MKLAIVAAVLVFAWLPVKAQVHGVPPSVTSIGPNGRSVAPPPSVTSMGPFGWQAPPKRFFFPHSPFFKNRFGANSFRVDHRGLNGAIVPYYIPYPVYAYPDESMYDQGMYGNDPQAQQQMMTPDGTGVAPPQVQPFVAGTAVPPQPAAPPAPPPAPYAPSPEVAAQEPTVLVFRDGHRIEVTNYAIVRDELINLSGNGPRRIKLEDLDLPATVRTNDDNGVTFRLPGAGGA
jgi:hypothetical protein